MSDPHSPIGPLLERQSRSARDLQDFREGQHQTVRILARNLEANTRALDGLRGEIEELRHEVRELGAEQASPA